MRYNRTQDNPMKYLSTRNPEINCSSLEALNQGLAPEGGLYVPEFIPKVELKQTLHLSFSALSTHILSSFLDDFKPSELSACIQEAYAHSFDTPDITPIVKGGRPFVLELFHGPTGAFKDVALQLLPLLLKTLKQDAFITSVLTATSGDTGSAALAGFKDIPGFQLTVFYPESGISSIQRKQMTTQSASNLKVYGIHGNFDEAQKALKEVFKHASTYPFPLTSANSINIGRFLPQITYYFKAYADLVAKKVLCMGDPVSFSVPTGNFGNILAAYVAKEMGLPIEHLLCASNENDVLTQLIQTGTYNRQRPFHITSSPSMDILVSSNLERLLYWLTDKNSPQVSTWMKQLDEEGSYTLDALTLKKLQQIFIPYRIDQTEVKDTIRTTYHTNRYVLDPHSAIAYAAATRYFKHHPDAIVITCATASPYKFPKTVLEALDLKTSLDDFENMDRLFEATHFPYPSFLNELKGQEEVHTQVLYPHQIRDVLLKDAHND